MSHGWREEREILKKILHFQDEKEIIFSQSSRGEREILKKILHFREEKEKGIFSEASRGKREILKKSRIEIEI